MYDPFDHYFKKAKQTGHRARSAFKLEEINDKFHLFTPQTQVVVDIGCAPGSWLQYASSLLNELFVSKKMKKKPLLIGFDVKETQPITDNVFTYKQDIEEVDAVKAILATHNVETVDLIISDMAPDTSNDKSTDAIRSIALIESTLWMYEQLLAPGGKFAIKVFMGPGFDQLREQLKTMFGAKNIKVFKPKSCRKNSKETYIVKI